MEPPCCCSANSTRRSIGTPLFQVLFASSRLYLNLLTRLNRLWNFICLSCSSHVASNLADVLPSIVGKPWLLRLARRAKFPLLSKFHMTIVTFLPLRFQSDPVVPPTSSLQNHVSSFWASAHNRRTNSVLPRLFDPRVCY